MQHFCINIYKNDETFITYFVELCSQRDNMYEFMN